MFIVYFSSVKLSAAARKRRRKERMMGMIVRAYRPNGSRLLRDGKDRSRWGKPIVVTARAMF
jgi:hypothetical protein